jgi:hypothetical protein
VPRQEITQLLKPFNMKEAQSPSTTQRKIGDINIKINNESIKGRGHTSPKKKKEQKTHNLKSFSKHRTLESA